MWAADTGLEPIDVLVGRRPELGDALVELCDSLVAGERQVIALIERLHRLSRGRSLPARGRQGASAGLMLYWLEHPPPALIDLVDGDARLAWAWEALRFAALRTRIPRADYAMLETLAADTGVCAEDGTLFGAGIYEQFDHRWAYAVLNCVLNLALPGKPRSFGMQPYVGRIEPASRLVLLGDWGTGDAVADAVLSQAVGLAPHCAVHLGGVYYVGADQQPPAGAQRLNFVGPWRRIAGELPSFALNSDHEMHAAGAGYFDIALDDPMFAHQKATSYFCLYNDDWLVLGLDSAYFSQSPMYAQGSLGDARDPQRCHQFAFIAELRALGMLEGRRILALTHHGAMDYTGSRPEALLGELYQALGRNPDVWYWGHVHNGIAYSEHSYAGRPDVGRPFLARCAGHGAMPFGHAWGLDRPEWRHHVDYHAKTPVAGGGARVRNGFAQVTLEGPDIEERFYEVGEQGVPQLAWSARH